MVSALARGLLTGVIVAAPVGPMALLAIRRTLERGWSSGLASGLGIATADGAYAAVAAFGRAAISGFLLGQARLVQIAGGLLIVIMALRALLEARRPTTVPSAPDARGLGSAYATCLGLTLANPPTILSFAAILAGLGVLASTRLEAVAVVAGTFAGSATWWVLLTGAIAAGRGRIDARWRHRISVVAALTLLMLGGGAVISTVR